MSWIWVSGSSIRPCGLAQPRSMAKRPCGRAGSAVSVSRHAQPALQHALAGGRERLQQGRGGAQRERPCAARRLAPGGVRRLVGRRLQPQPAPAEGAGRRLGERLQQARAEPLAVDLHHPAGGDAEHAVGGPVGLQRPAEGASWVLAPAGLPPRPAKSMAISPLKLRRTISRPAASAVSAAAAPAPGSCPRRSPRARGSLRW